MIEEPFFGVLVECAGQICAVLVFADCAGGAGTGWTWCGVEILYAGGSMAGSWWWGTLRLGFRTAPRAVPLRPIFRQRISSSLTFNFVQVSLPFNIASLLSKTSYDGVVRRTDLQLLVARHEFDLEIQ
jgi:hypothetical protein